jgi:hypothetical protein
MARHELDRSALGLGQVADTCKRAMNPWVPYNGGNFLTSREPVSFSKRTLIHGVSKCEVSLLELLMVRSFHRF